MKLALGTVQFGLDYGIANRRGRVPEDEAASIVQCARKAGIDTLDTAIGYGDSEQTLGRIGMEGWRVVTKLPAVPADCADVPAWIRSSVEGALGRLRVRSLYGLLLHRPQQLLGPYAASIVRTLAQLKEEGAVRKTGVSIYEPSELDAVRRHRFDLVQAPFNLLDRRMISTGWLDRLVDWQTELHVRSVFLQGLLLMPTRERPAAFDRWGSVWSVLDAWLDQANLTSLQACLRYALSFPQISRVVVGVDSVAQLTDILAAAAGPVPAVPRTLDTDDVDLLNPGRWNVPRL